MSGLVFDLGGTHLRAAVAGLEGGLSAVIKERLLSTADGLAAPAVWERIRKRLHAYVRDNLAATPAGSPIVLSFPGPIGADGRILQAPTLTGGAVDSPDLRADLHALSGRPVYLLNDLSAAAWYLSGSIAGRFLVVTVSSGIGSKLFDPRIGVLDDVGYAGEIGHAIADPSVDAVQCDCGGRGHLGAIASGRGIERWARRHAGTDPDAFAQSLCVARHGATATSLTNEAHLVPALHHGDQWAISMVTQCTRFLARSLAQAIIVAGLRNIVVIGGFALAAGNDYLCILHSALREACDYILLKDEIAGMVTLGQVDEEACLLGAAMYARRIRLPQDEQSTLD